MAISPSVSNTILKIFIGGECLGCGKSKPTNNAFCRGCYHSLPSDMKRALWQRFGSGFEEAFIAALAHFKVDQGLISGPEVAK